MRFNIIMKILLFYLALLIAGIFLGNKMALHYFPNMLFEGAKEKIGTTENEFRYAAIPDENSRFVTKPNPDFLYATCFYNLEDGPLHLIGNMPDSTYWSIALYEPNTVNFYVKNDMEFNTDKLDLIISKNEINNLGKERNIISPSEKGLILFRILVTDNSPENVERYEAFQKSIMLEPYETG